MAQDNHLDLRETFVAVAREGHEEMNRPSTSLFWSAVAAGLLISFSLLFKALLRAEVHGMPTAHAIESFGYTIGFVFVILARLQLFTENTISPVLPTISVPSRKNIYNTGRVWVLSLTGNLVGTCLIALLFARTAMVPQESLEAMIEISREVADISFGNSLVRGIPAGLLIGALVWMKPRAGGSVISLIILVTYLIALADFTHVIVGSCEMFLLAWSGNGNVLGLLWNNVFPTLIGNLIGGTGLFALLSWAQIRDEVRKEVATLRARADLLEE